MTDPGVWWSWLAQQHLPLTVGTLALLLTVWLAYRLPAARKTAWGSLGLAGSSYLLLLALPVTAGNALTLLRLGEVLLALLLGLALIRLLTLGLFRLLLPRIYCTLPKIAEDIFLIVVSLGWLFIELRHVGLDPGSLIATSAVITAVLAFALQDTLGNILGGIALQLDHSFAIGDWIELERINGRVVEIHWRYTAVETRDWETVIIPNSLLMKNRFKVLGRRQGSSLPRWRRTIHFHVDYSHAPGRVIALTETALREAQLPQLATQPAPHALLMELRGSYGRYALRYWLLDFAVDDPTDSQVRVCLYTALQRAGISPAIEQQVIEWRPEPGALTQAALYQDPMKRLLAIQHIELFQELTPEEQESLAQRLVYAPFMPGETITRQGAIANWLYIITSGEAEVFLETGLQRTKVNTLTAGDFFGEMALLTGAPRSATVVASSPMECFRLDKEGFEGILRARPGLAEVLSITLTQRRQALRDVQASFTSSTQTARPGNLSPSRELLAHIQRFFGLHSS